MAYHETCMQEAIALGRYSLPSAGTNPATGAIVAKDGRILGRGFHRGPGSPHAETIALRCAMANAGSPAALRGADLYATLEPCCHSRPGKREVSCAQAIIEAGIRRVFYACRDPNPAVDGKGHALLAEAGIEVHGGFMEGEASTLVEAFSVSIREGRPFVRLKWAQSLDGRIACASGESKWITDGAARAASHGLRAFHDAILVGAGTLRRDDPELTVRLCAGRDPLRLVLAGREELPLGARAFGEESLGRTRVVAVEGSKAARRCAERGIPLIEARPGKDGLVDLPSALGALYSCGIGSLLVEGGRAVLGAFVRAGLCDALTVFCAPLLVGEGISALGGLGIGEPSDALRLVDPRVRRVGGCLRIDARLAGESRGGAACSPA